mmetsp:Transcript_23383/g.55302  ORF Transcript_23383/g.55302 Transcript_23383/m.55302 type:complete len:297 (-) Transcript_23383:436-1326(-)
MQLLRDEGGADGDAHTGEDHHEARVAAGLGLRRGGCQHHPAQHEGPSFCHDQRDGPRDHCQLHHRHMQGPGLQHCDRGVAIEDQRLRELHCGDHPRRGRRIPRGAEQEQRGDLPRHLAGGAGRDGEDQEDGRAVAGGLHQDPRRHPSLSSAGRLQDAPWPPVPPGQQLPRERELRPARRLGHRGGGWQRVQDRCVLLVTARQRRHEHRARDARLRRVAPGRGVGDRPLQLQYSFKVQADRPPQDLGIKGSHEDVLRRSGLQVGQGGQFAAIADRLEHAEPLQGAAVLGEREECQAE